MDKETALTIWPVFALIMVLCVWILIMSVRQGKHGRLISDVESKVEKQSAEFHSAINELRTQFNGIDRKLDILIERK